MGYETAPTLLTGYMAILTFNNVEMPAQAIMLDVLTDPDKLALSAVRRFRTAQNHKPRKLFEF